MARDLQKGMELADRYTLQRKLGAGADTETWLATDRMTRSSAALKIVSSDRLTGEALRREWQTSIRLMHPHIVRAFEFHDIDGQPFYSLQFVDGDDISVLSGAPLADVLPPLALVADALRYAHAKSVVHRDVKASNILLDHNGAPYLSDFGAAASTGGEASGGSLIAASPQSLAGEPPTPADDIFALGGLIYELVAGRSPWSSDQVRDDILASAPQSLTAASGADVPPAVQELVASMLQKEAADRPTAEEVVAALTAAGYPGAPAPAGYIDTRGAANEEVIEASTPLRSRQSAAAAASATRAAVQSGISPRTLGIGLAVLILLLAGVIFLLPRTVNEKAGTAPTPAAPASEEAASEAPAALPQRDERVVARAETEAVLGRLLSMMETLEKRAVERWGGMSFRQAREIYEAGDAAYLARDYATASEKYTEAIAKLEPLLDEVDRVFEATFTEARAALEAANPLDAVRLFDLAVAISPGHAGAAAGFERAKNLDQVLKLTDQGKAFEKELEFLPAQQSFERAVEIDPQWEPARAGLERVNATIEQMQFDQRMTEGLTALADGHYDAARAAFRMAQQLKPASSEPADGLLQVEQETRLNQIADYERQVQSQEQDEEWAQAVETYEKILEIDGNLQFALQGLQQARRMTALHEQLDAFIGDPDSLSAPATMQRATTMVVDITRMPGAGPRLAGKRDELSRLLKRAATPVEVQLVSDNKTEVAVYKVGKLGTFETHELNLRPGKYVAVGSRPGYRDVRLEFLVGPERDNGPIVIRCEEPI